MAKNKKKTKKDKTLQKTNRAKKLADRLVQFFSGRRKKPLQVWRIVKNGAKPLAKPSVAAALASAAIHGLFAVTLPVLPSLSKTEEPDTPRTVNIVELTPEEQARLPQMTTFDFESLPRRDLGELPQFGNPLPPPPPEGTSRSYNSDRNFYDFSRSSGSTSRRSDSSSSGYYYDDYYYDDGSSRSYTPGYTIGGFQLPGVPNIRDSVPEDDRKPSKPRLSDEENPQKGGGNEDGEETPGVRPPEDLALDGIGCYTSEQCENLMAGLPSGEPQPGQSGGSTREQYEQALQTQETAYQAWIERLAEEYGDDFQTTLLKENIQGIYPSQTLKNRGVTGNAIVGIFVADGEVVESPEILRSSGVAELDNAAIDFIVENGDFSLVREPTALWYQVVYDENSEVRPDNDIDNDIDPPEETPEEPRSPYENWQVAMLESYPDPLPENIEEWPVVDYPDPLILKDPNSQKAEAIFDVIVRPDGTVESESAISPAWRSTGNPELDNWARDAILATTFPNQETTIYRVTVRFEDPGTAPPQPQNPPPNNTKPEPGSPNSPVPPPGNNSDRMPSFDDPANSNK